MAIPPDFVRASLTASLQGGEQMVHGLFIKNVGAPIGGSNLQTLADGLRDRWNDFLYLANPGFGVVAARLSNTTKYQKVTVYKIDPLLQKASDLAEAAFADGAGTQPSTNPTELALCATLLTGAPGRSARGRMYLGGFGANTITNDGRVNVTAAQEISNSLARFLRSVRDIAVGAGEPDQWEPQIVSGTRTTARKITQVSIGDVWDVQRRRRNKLVETRFQAAVN